MSTALSTRKQKQVSFDVTAAQAQLIKRIVLRAVAVAMELGFDPIDKLSLEMDITATHANGTPLRLAELLAAWEPDFVHDVWGIQRHIDRRTGKLGGHFLPRFARKEG